MKHFEVGDIVIGNNSWLNGLLGYTSQPGVIIHTNNHSSAIYLFMINEDIVLLNQYVDKIKMSSKKDELKIGDLVELKPEIKNIIIDATVIRTSDFDKKWKDDEINAFLVYFPEEDYEYTIPRGCLKLFSKQD